jgi:hypothetical protein
VAAQVSAPHRQGHRDASLSSTAGYLVPCSADLMFDRAVAYLHLPGIPLFLGEMVLGVGALAAIIETRHSQQRRAVNQDQVE